MRRREVYSKLYGWVIQRKSSGWVQARGRKESSGRESTVGAFRRWRTSRQRGGGGMEEIAEVRGKLSQNCIHCACTISRSRRERMREGERELREAGKVPDFSCRSGKIDLEDEIGDKGISKGNGFSPLFFTSQES